MPASFHRCLEQLKFTLLAAAAVIPPIAVSKALLSIASRFHIGGTVFKAIEFICFFAVLVAEALAYDKFHQWRLRRGQ